MTTTALLIVSLGVAAIVLEAQCVFLPKRANGYSGRDSIVDPKKRPFCNAFTGCGRKRSDLPPMTGMAPNPEETLGNLLELNAEPAVEDLSRQIMSEAKLWEAIQEANMELLRRKQAAREGNEDGARGAVGSCAVPPCYI